MTTKEIGDYCFDFKKLLGKGGFATVYEGWEIKTKRPVAVRVINRVNLNMKLE